MLYFPPSLLFPLTFKHYLVPTGELKHMGRRPRNTAWQTFP